MFSRSLFKQSCKANKTMWSIITFAVCFMLACVMLIAGNGTLGETKDAIENTIIEGELDSQVKSRALNYYYTSDISLSYFDKTFSEEFAKATAKPETLIYAKKMLDEALNLGMNQIDALNYAKLKTAEYLLPGVYKTSLLSLNSFLDELLTEKGYALDSVEALELKGLVMCVLNPVDEEGKYQADYFYEENKEEAPRYDLTTLMLDSKAYLDSKRVEYVKDYTFKNSLIFLSGNMVKEENVSLILNELSKYGVTFEKYQEMGFNEYSKIKDIGTKALIDFRANFDYRISHLKEGETEEMVLEELTRDITTSLLASLPKEVSEALDEIGQADLYGVLVGSIFFKMAGLLLPIIFMIMTANSLIAGQVDSGSMAYILSTSTKRSSVVFTQAIYLITSLFTMFFLTSITSIVCYFIVDVDTTLNVGKLLVINLGAFLVLFAMSGISFLTSCIFNRSKRSMAIGGGLNMFFLVATMLGLFGSEVLPSILRMDALNSFNYVSIISLFDVVNILDGGYIFIYKLLILLGIGTLGYIIGAKYFEHKDLPL